MSAKEKSTTNATTSEKPKIKGGRGMMNGDTGRKFSKENQPSPEAKSRGQIKRFRGQELARYMLNLTYIDDHELKVKIAEFMGIDVKEVTVEQVMVYKQMQKAIAGQDTQAFNAVIDRAFGKPKEYHEVLEVEVKSDEAVHAEKMKKIRESFDERF